MMIYMNDGGSFLCYLYRHLRLLIAVCGVCICKGNIHMYLPTHWYDGKGTPEVLFYSEATSGIVKLTAVVRSTKHCHQLCVVHIMGDEQ